jgi:hypothetical protein
MSWFNMGGLNPKFKDFLDKHPGSTVIGVGWAFYWRFALIVLLIEGFVFALVFGAGAAFGGFHHERGGYMHKDWNMGPGTATTSAPAAQGKLNIDVVCQGALSYMTFPDAASAKVFVDECKEGKHPEVIERYKADMNLGDGATI